MEVEGKLDIPANTVIAKGAFKEKQATVPLVMYDNDIRIEIGTAVVDTETLIAKGKIDEAKGRELTEVIGTVFRWGAFSVDRESDD